MTTTNFENQKRCLAIKKEMNLLSDRIDALADGCEVCRAWAWLLQDDFMKLARELRFIRRKMSGAIGKNEITDDMKAAARRYPIDRLIEFNRGLSLAFCHQDKKPSLSHFVKANRATCFPCGKSFDPIGVLIVRDGMSFPAAVRLLAGS
jgi:hypothetical protein